MEAARARTDEDFEDHLDTSSLVKVNSKPGTSIEPEWNQTGGMEGATGRKPTSLDSSVAGSFDDFFESSRVDQLPEPDRNQPGSTQDEALTLKEAVAFYKISEKTIRLHIAQGKIPARKEQGPKGLEWRIYPAGIPEEIEEVESITELEISDNHPGTDLLEDIDQDGTNEGKDRNHPGTRTEPDRNQTSELERLLTVIQKQAEKLEAANYRIGYLEAQTVNYQEQVKLLTDSRRKRSGWSRFWGWFLGK